MSRRARSVSLTRYGTGAPERFQAFARRTYAAFFHIFEAFADTLGSVGWRRYIEQPLIGFGIWHDRFGLSVDGKNQRFSRLFQMFQEFRRITAKCRHGLHL